MKEVIILIILFVNNNGVTKSYGVKDYFRSFLAKQIPNLRQGILPGTVWCGRGNIARKESELGIYHAEMDQCCRDHHYCEDYIKPKTTKYGLYNNYSICRSSLCECEEQFYDCLTQLCDFYAYTVKKIYFRKCKQCFRIFYDPQECENEGLDIIEETDRKGCRVFCARFDRNSKWDYRHGTTSESISATEVPTWDDDEFIPLVSLFYSGEDVENNVTYENNTSIEDND